MKRLSWVRSRVWILPLVALSTLSGLVSQAWAESSRVVRVEEHWELRVADPDSGVSAPQVTMLMAPVATFDGLHFLVTLNHATAPEYTLGGIQVQAWNGEQLLNSQSVHDGESLDQSEEVVTWVQRMTIQNGQVAFQVREGSSESWGSFGGDGLTLSASTTLTGLNSYRPGTSLSESQVGYAENRVYSLTLTKLVWETEDGTVHEQNAPIPVDTSLDD